MSLFRQLWALLIKDLFIRKLKRHYVLSLLELIIPLSILVIVVLLRKYLPDSDTPGTWNGPNTYPPFGPFTEQNIAFDSFNNATIIYAPNTKYAEAVVKGAYKSSAKNIEGYNTVHDLNVRISDTNKTVSLAIIFPDTPDRSNLQYTLRFDSKYPMYIGSMFSGVTIPRPFTNFTKEERRLLWPSMYAIFDEHIQYFKLKTPNFTYPQMQPFPTGRYFSLSNGGTFYELVGELITVLGSMGFLSFFVSLCKGIIIDKETRLRELLRMMGLSDVVYWTNIVLCGLVVGTVICLLCSFMLCFEITDLAVLQHSNPILIFLVFLCFLIGSILIMMLISVFCNSPKAGTIVVILYSIGCQVLMSARFGDRSPDKTDYISTPAWMKLLSSVLPDVGFSWAFKVILLHEVNGVGVHWNNLWQPAITGDNISLGSVLLAQFLSWFALLLFVVYLDAVAPWQYGVPKHPLFFLKRKFWCSDSDTPDIDSMALLENTEDQMSAGELEMIERITADIGRPVVHLQHITHNFSSMRAVDNLSLELYPNQITVLLGHNGAGKTTTMNILTGLFPPSEGEIFINGFSVRHNTKKAREGIGLCPQHNVLFDDLTVEEHLWFFARLKGAPSGLIEAEMTNLLDKVSLMPKLKTLAKDLSGGMKRKLCLANAMVGGSRILILDEPTSGMDPESRRFIWTLLQEERRNRTVLMTTHYMEEADVLGDRIAILSKGKLLCSGSPMFLKRKFATGYKLRLTKTSHNTNVAKVTDTIKQALQNEASGVNLLSNMGYEFVINIGFPSADSLVSMFRTLEENKPDLAISTIGASVTTMEDVFLKIGKLDEAQSKIPMEGATIDMFDRIPQFERLEGLPLYVRQMKGLWMKRFHATRREWKLAMYLGFWPMVLTAMYCLLLRSSSTSSEVDLSYSFKRELGSSEGFIINGTDSILDKIRKQFEADGVSVHNLNFVTKKQIDTYLLGIAENKPSAYKAEWSAGAQQNTLWFNGQPFHVAATAIAKWQAAALTELTGAPSNVQVKNKPIGRTSSANPILAAFLQVRFLAGSILSLAASYLTCQAIIYQIQERESKSKLIQLMTGVRRIVFFGASLTFDLGLVLISAMGMIIVFFVINPYGGFTSFPDTFVALWTLLFMYGYAMIPLAYVASYIFKDSSSGFSTFLNVTIIPVMIVGPIFTLLDYIHSLAPGGNLFESLPNYIRLASFFPAFSAFWGISNIHINGMAKNICDSFKGEEIIFFCQSEYFSSCCQPCPTPEEGEFCFVHESPFSLNVRNGAGFQILALFILGTISFALLVLVESNTHKFVAVLELIRWQRFRTFLSRKWFRRADQRPTANIDKLVDSDVLMEKSNVELALRTNRENAYALIVHDLTKYYGIFKAVDGISFLVKENECFGLLGVNGAGKTTTFGMLTGDLLLSGGNAFIKSSNLRTSMRRFQCEVGFCPQFDALIDTMTGEEILELYCALRGVPPSQTMEVVSFMIGMADLQPYAKNLTVSYSGGNKRKLSIAIAMIGNPQVLFLDEPTAGVDPGARRKIWFTLSQAQKELGSAIVLTSHSMEECEALCHRLAIMVNGGFRCLGSAQHLKSKFGRGFTVYVKLSDPSDEKETAICDRMEILFNGRCQLKQSYQCLLQFHITDTTIHWSELFARIQKLRRETTLNIEDVQVSDTTLEEVFLNFAKESHLREQSESPIV